ncbi:hypothetical protein D3C71_1460780 [compost metagenome]
MLLREEPLGHGGTADRLGNISGDTGLLTGFDILDLEVSAVCNRLDPVDTERFHRRLHRWRKKPHVENLVVDLLFGDQLVLHINGELDVVADADLRHACHCTGIWIGQRDLVLTGVVQFIQ